MWLEKSGISLTATRIHDIIWIERVEGKKEYIYSESKLITDSESGPVCLNVLHKSGETILYFFFFYFTFILFHWGKIESRA